MLGQLLAPEGRWDPGLCVPGAGVEKPLVAQDVGPLPPGGLPPRARQLRADHAAQRCSTGPGMQPTPTGWHQEAAGNLEGPIPAGVKGAPTWGPLAASRQPKQAAPAWAHPSRWPGQRCSDAQVARERRARDSETGPEGWEGAGEGALQARRPESREGGEFKLGAQGGIPTLLPGAEQLGKRGDVGGTLTPAPRGGRDARPRNPRQVSTGQPRHQAHTHRKGQVSGLPPSQPTAGQATTDQARRRRTRGRGVTRWTRPDSSIQSETRQDDTHFPSACLLCCSSLLLPGFPGGSVVKNPPAMQGTRVQPRIRKVPWSRERWKWQPTPVPLPGKSHGQRSLGGRSPEGHKSRTRLRDRTAASWLPDSKLFCSRGVCAVR